jgi:hypothetical protein
MPPRVSRRIAARRARRARLAAALAIGERWRCALPPDVLRTIFSLLAHDTRFVCAVACVCSAWRAVAINTPALWCELRLDTNFLYERHERHGMRNGARIDDDAVACLTRRARGGLTLVTLGGVTQITDACLVHFLPRAAPLLTTLHLSSCSSITARGVADTLRGARLTSLALRGTAPVRDREKKDDAALLRALQALIPGGSLHENAVCCYESPEAAGRCGYLFHKRIGDVCNICQEVFCYSAYPLHTRQCDDCHTSVCGDGECLEFILLGRSWRVPVSGFVCGNTRIGCRSMLCGACVARRHEGPPREGGLWNEGGHAFCGVCKTSFCDECACNGAVCEGASKGRVPVGACLRFVCESCLPRDDDEEENVVVCAECSATYCRLRACAGRDIRTESATRARCHACRSRDDR